MTIPCPVQHCDRPADRGRPCGACTADLHRALNDVRWLAAQLDLTLSRQHTRDGGGTGEIEDDPTPAVLHIGPLGMDPRASEAAWILRNTLHGWTKVMQEGVVPAIGPVCDGCEHPSCQWIPYSQIEVADTCASMAAWLSAGLERLVGHEAGAEACGEIVAAVRAAVRVVDRPVGHVYAGPCSGCATALYARPGAAKVTCRDCGEHHDIADRYEWMRAQCEDLLGSSSYVAMVCTGLGVKISESTVRMWVKRHKLRAHTYTEPRSDDAIESGRRRPLYRVGDVIDVALGNVQQYSA